MHTNAKVTITVNFFLILGKFQKSPSILLNPLLLHMAIHFTLNSCLQFGGGILFKWILDIVYFSCLTGSLKLLIIVL